MTRHEALAMLGLEGEPSDDVVRRSYMRKLRDYPPERDPDGFARLRAAHDLLRASAPRRPVEGATEAAPVVVNAPHVAVDSPADASPVVVDAPPDSSPHPSLADELEPEQLASSPPMYVAIAILSEMLVDGDIIGALKTAGRWQAAGLEDTRNLGGGDITARWILLRDLLSISRDLPSVLVPAFARAIVTGQLRDMSAALGALRKRSRREGEAARLLIARRAPRLWKQIRQYPGAANARVVWAFRIGVIVILVGASAIGGMVGPGSTDGPHGPIASYKLASPQAMDEIANLANKLDTEGTPPMLASPVVSAAMAQDCKRLMVAFPKADAASPMTDTLIAIHKLLPRACEPIYGARHQ